MRTWMAARARTSRLFGVVTMTCKVKLLPVWFDVATRTDFVGALSDTGTSSPFGNVIWSVNEMDVGHDRVGRVIGQGDGN